MTQPAEQEEPSADYLVEEPKPFSQSLLWELQRQFYAQHGIGAWSEGKIPFSISTSNHIAAAYARVVFGFLRDCLPTLDLSEPVYIVEVGAGSGRLGFNFLKQFSQFFDESNLAHVPFTYVLTDLVESNVEFWESHPALKPFVEAGRLDFAKFDAVADERMELRHSGRVLEAGGLKNPVVVVANYILDSLPQDLFSIEGGELFAVTTSLYSIQPEPDLLDPDIIGRMDILYDRYKVDEHFYGDEHTARILKLYRDTFESTVLLFPRMAMDCVEAIRRFANGRMLLLAGDKGDHEPGAFEAQDIPAIQLHHNGFSAMFNYHALKQHVENLEGEVFTTSFRYVSLNILAFVLGMQNTAETRQAYRDHIDHNSPDDNFTLLLGFEKWPEVSLIGILAYLRARRYDTHSFLLVYPLLSSRLKAFPDELIPELRNVVNRVWDTYYHMNENFDLTFYLGVVLSAIGDFAESVTFFQMSLEKKENHPTALFNIAVSQLQLKHFAAGLAALDQLPAEQQSQEQVAALRSQLLAGHSAAN